MFPEMEQWKSKDLLELRRRIVETKINVKLFLIYLLLDFFINFRNQLNRIKLLFVEKCILKEKIVILFIKMENTVRAFRPESVKNTLTVLKKF